MAEMSQLGQTYNRWLSDEGAIYVDFDEGGGLKEKRFFPVMVVEVSLLDRVRGWLGF